MPTPNDVSRLAVRLIAFASLVATALLSHTLSAQAPPGCPGAPALFHTCAQAAAKTFRPPRTRDGRPNLQGFWRGQTSGSYSLVFNAILNSIT